MKTHWMALGVGVLVGAAAAYFMTKGSGANTIGGGITGTQNAPYQANITGRR